MKRLLENFEELFDLDYRVDGARLGDLIDAALGELEDHPVPDWGSPGAANEIANEADRYVSFYYVPHLFPGMDLKLRLAHKLQFHLVPRDLPPDAPLSLAAVLESYCHLSGDLFGWETLRDGKFLLWILDLAGHGVRAGLASAVLRVIINRRRARSRVGAFVGELNATLCACLRPELDSVFATGFFAVVDADGDTVYTSAGHPPVLLRRSAGAVEQLGSTSRPIGFFPDETYTTRQIRIEPGDLLLLYTDGLLESTNDDGELFGIERLREFLSRDFASPEEVTGKLYQEVSRHQDLSKLDDDVSFVAAMRPRRT